jgi:hypothetical protein
MKIVLIAQGGKIKINILYMSMSPSQTQGYRKTKQQDKITVQLAPHTHLTQVHMKRNMFNFL